VQSAGAIDTTHSSAESRMRLHSVKRFICLAVCSVTLIACARARPEVALKWPGFQEKADATRDWKVVAHQIALDMMRRGLLPDPSSTNGGPAPTEQAPYYIRVAIPTSPFLHEVRQSLQSEILYHGGSVAASPLDSGVAVIDLGVDVVQWPSAYSLHDGAPATEAAWEASITSGNRVVFDVRYPMYVNESDVSHYAAAPVGPAPVRLSYTP
jgi:hypothetical protein